MRSGVRAIFGVSFVEIFLSNCTALGIPCVAVAPAGAAWLVGAVAREPDGEVDVDVDGQRVTFAGCTIHGRLPDGARRQLVTGTWDATGGLLEARPLIERVAASLP